MSTEHELQYARNYYNANKASINQKRKERRLWQSREYKDKQRDLSLKSQYGISLKEYEEMLERQGGACAICKGVQQGRSLAVDHDHVTGEVRELLCDRCNHALGHAKEDIHLLNEMILYIKKHNQRRNR